MAFWFYRGLRRGIVTTRYPRGRPDAWTSDLPTAPAFHSTRLTYGLVRRLIAVCPTGAITSDDSHLVIDLGRCTGCRRCTELDRDAAAPSGESLLAAPDRKSLIKRVRIEGTERGDDR